MKRLWLLALAVSLPTLGWAQSAPISGFVIDQYGSPVAGAQVYICSAAGSTGLPCSPVANIYYDYNLHNPAPNPYPTDANGDFSVYVGPLAFPNTYVVNAVPVAGTIYTWLYPGPSCPLSGCTFTGNVTAPLYNATQSPYFEINGVQISSSALSDASNIAYINAQNTFTGNKQTAPIWNATTSFDVNGIPLASANLSDAANLVYLNALNVFTGATNTFKAIIGTTITGTTINAISVFQVNGTPLSAANLSNGVSGSGAVCLASGSACALSYTEYYQTVAINGVAQTQRPTLNFSSYFTATDSSSPAETTIAPVTTGTESKLVTAAAAGAATDCGVWDSNGGMGDAGFPCYNPSALLGTSSGYWTIRTDGGSGVAATYGGYFYGNNLFIGGNTYPLIEQFVYVSSMSTGSIALPMSFPHHCLGATATDNGNAGTPSPNTIGATCNGNSLVYVACLGGTGVFVTVYGY